MVSLDQNRFKPYGHSFILCELPKPTSVCGDNCFYPAYVSISADLDSKIRNNSNNQLYVTYPAQGKPKQQFGLCVKAVYEYENPQQFVEFVEYYIKMGVTSFTFFNASIGLRTSCLLKEVYKNVPDVTVEILPWTLDFEPFASFYHGQGIQLQECIYRYRGRVKYLVSLDLDELIVPGPKGGTI